MFAQLFIYKNPKLPEQGLHKFSSKQKYSTRAGTVAELVNRFGFGKTTAILLLRNID